MRHRGQITIEFLMLMSFIFVVSVGFVLISASQMRDLSEDRKQQVLEEFADSVHRELTLATGVRDGYIRTFELPINLEGYDYNMTMVNTTITFEMEGNVQTNSIPPLSGALAKGKNTLRKINGTIYITNG